MAEVARAGSIGHRMSHNGKHLVHVDWLGVLPQIPSRGVMGGKALTLSSTFCQCFSRCAEAAVPDFLENRAMCLHTSSYSGACEIVAPCANAPNWKAECNEPQESLARNFAGRVNF